MLDFIVNNVISAEVEHQKLQRKYFTARAKAGPIVKIRMWQPFAEPEQGDLIAIFVEPGAAHLVFWDEIAPFSDLDKKYRQLRQKIFGRFHDVESLEFVDQHVKFINNFSSPNVYESSFHWTSLQTYEGTIYSDTWNHMLSVCGTPFNLARGGYREVQYETFQGDRAAAEAFEEVGK